MKKTFALKPLALSLAVAGAASVAMVPATSQAGVSANVGFVTDYFFRGIKQSDAAANGGLDFESDSGFYAGTWVSEVGGGNELEYDLYAGWGGEFEGVSLGLGVAGYYYTGDVFDTSYEEVALSVGYGPVSIGYEIGSWEDMADDGDDAKYTDLSLDLSYESFTATVGKYEINDDDVELEGVDNLYIELGYGFDLGAGFEGSLTYVRANYDADGVDDTNDLVFGVSKSFDLM